jgi:SMODS-associating 4TM effector domain
VLALSAASNPILQFDSAFSGLALAMLDTSIIYYLIVTRRHAAAQLADCFDRYLFSGTPYENLPCTPPIDSITVDAERHLARRGVRDKLADWYDRRLAELPPDLAHLAALRINAFRDTRLRGTYIVKVIGSAVAIGVVAWYLFSRNSMSPERLLPNVLVPLTPALLWLARDLVEQIDALIRKNEFKRCAGALWNDALRHRSSPAIEAKIEYLQGLLLAYRRSDVSVPGWLYRVTRRRLHRDVETRR